MGGDSMTDDGKGRRRLVIVAAAGALAVIAVAAWWLVRGDASSTDGMRPVAVARGDIAESILATGTVQPENRLEIKPPIAGRVEAVLVDEGQVVKKGQTLILMSSAERAALLDAARARGPEELRRWEGYYRPAPILASIDGTVIGRSVEPGQSFTSQEVMIVISDRLTVKAQVDETDIARIRPKQEATVILDAYPQDPMPSRVDQIAYDSKTVNNVTTYVVDVLPDETPDFMRSGMTANVRFTGEARSGVLLLPGNAVRNRDGRRVVLVAPASGGGAPREEEVKVGITDGKMIEILSGLAEGDEVLAAAPKNGKGGEAKSQTRSPLNPFPPRRR